MQPLPRDPASLALTRRLAAETEASLVESPRFLFQPWEQNPLPRVSSRPQCQFGAMICSRQGLVLRMDNSPKAFLAAHVFTPENGRACNWRHCL
jgi:hypothetical protein